MDFGEFILFLLFLFILPLLLKGGIKLIYDVLSYVYKIKWILLILIMIGLVYFYNVEIYKWYEKQYWLK